MDRLEIVDATEALIGRYQLENIGAIDRLALPFAIEEHLRARLGHLCISKRKKTCKSFDQVFGHTHLVFRARSYKIKMVCVC